MKIIENASVNWLRIVIKNNLISLIMSLILVSCGGEASEDALVGVWQRTLEEESFDGQVFAAASSCRDDDVVEYAADGTWTQLQGTRLCEGSVGTTLTGTWRRVGAATIAEIFDGSIDEYSFTIDKLDDELFIRTHGTGFTSGPTQLRFHAVRSKTD